MSAPNKDLGTEPTTLTSDEVEADKNAEPTPVVEPTPEAKPAPKPRAKDPLTTITPDQLPVVAHVGQVAVSVQDFNSAAVLSVSLVGWVGEPEFRIRAEDIGELEEAISSIRKQLKK